MELHQKLRFLREKRGYGTQKAFCYHAQKSGFNVNLRRYGSIERGDIRPNIDDIIEICKAMQISSDEWLLEFNTDANIKLLTTEEMLLVKSVIEGLIALRNR